MRDFKIITSTFVAQSAFLAATLLHVGHFLYHESLTCNEAAEAMICLIRLVFIYYK